MDVSVGTTIRNSVHWAGVSSIQEGFGQNDRHSSYHSAELQLTNAQKGAIRTDSQTPLLVRDHMV